MRKRLFIILLITIPMIMCAQKTGISLSGGAALGYAHIGFLQAMDEAGVKPDCISGTSMGAIMGMMYCAGYTPQEIKQIVKNERMDELVVLARPGLHHRGGLVGTEKIQQVLLKYVPHNSFDSLKIPFYCCTVNMNTLELIYRGKGDQLVQYVMASAAVPAVFAPVTIDGDYYVDGGVLCNLPVQPLLEEACDKRIAVNLRLVKPMNNLKARNIWNRAFMFSIYATSFRTLTMFTDTVEIDPGTCRMYDFNRLDDLCEIGYRTGRQHFSKKP